MDLTFDEMSCYVALAGAYNDVCMESLSSDSRNIDKRLSNEILSYNAEFTRAMNSGDYNKVIEICDQVMNAIDAADKDLKALDPEKNRTGLHIFAAVLLTLAGIIGIGGTPYFMEASAKGFAALIKRLTGRVVGNTAVNVVRGATLGISVVGTSTMTVKGYLDLLKHAYAPPKSDFADDPHAHNVDYRIAAQSIRDAREVIKTIRDNTVAYLKENEGTATESDMSLLMEAACEAIDTEELLNDPALESLGSESRNAQKELIKRGREIYARLAAAYNRRDYDASVKCLDELESVVKEFEDKLDSMKAEGIIGRAFGKVAALAIVILGAIAIFKANSFTVPLVGALGNIVKTLTGGIGTKLAGRITTGAVFAGNFAAGTVGFNMIQKTISNAMAARKGKRENPDDPRYANGDYAAAREIVKELKALINRSRVEVMSLKRAQPQMA